MIEVSIVIPAYNAEHWIEEALASVLAQTYSSRALEVIIVDDGSTDATATVADAVLRNGSIVYRICRSANGGPGRARNIGWREANGAWIQFLDADDTLHPGKVSLQIAVASQVGVETAVIYSNWQWVASGASSSSMPRSVLRRPVIRVDPVADLIKSENFIATGSQLFRRSWLEKVDGFDEQCRLIEDVHLMLRIAMQGGQFVKVPGEEPLFCYRQRDNSLSQSSAAGFMEACLRNAQMVEAYWRTTGQLTSSHVAFLADVYSYGARFYAGVDRKRFGELADRLEFLVDGFVPDGPPALRWLSRLLGYRYAEQIAGRYRLCRRYLRVY